MKKVIAGKDMPVYWSSSSMPFDADDIRAPTNGAGESIMATILALFDLTIKPTAMNRLTRAITAKHPRTA